MDNKVKRNGGIVIWIKNCHEARLSLLDVESENDTITVYDAVTRTAYVVAYVPPDETKNRSMTAINDIMGHVNAFARSDCKVVLLGDWNCRFKSQDIHPEKIHSGGSWKRADYLKECMILYNLSIVTPAGKKKYTYYKKRKDTITKTTVDHVLILNNAQWENNIGVSVRTDLRHTSDHCPLIVKTNLCKRNYLKDKNDTAYYVKEDLENIKDAEKEVLTILNARKFTSKTNNYDEIVNAIHKVMFKHGVWRLKRRRLSAKPKLASTDDHDKETIVKTLCTDLKKFHYLHRISAFYNRIRELKATLPTPILCQKIHIHSAIRRNLRFFILL
jgi:exonuclease III